VQDFRVFTIGESFRIILSFFIDSKEKWLKPKKPMAYFKNQKKENLV
jgi:hypothetical protein